MMDIFSPELIGFTIIDSIAVLAVGGMIFMAIKLELYK